MERVLFVRLYIVDSKDRRILASSSFRWLKFRHFHTITSPFKRFSEASYLLCSVCVVGIELGYTKIKLADI